MVSRAKCAELLRANRTPMIHRAKLAYISDMFWIKAKEEATIRLI